MDVDGAAEGGEDGVDVGLVATGGVAGERGAEDVEADVVARGLEEIAKAGEEVGAAVTGGKIVAEVDDAAGAGVGIEGVEGRGRSGVGRGRSGGVEATVGAEVGDGESEGEAGWGVGCARVGFLRPV